MTKLYFHAANRTLSSGTLPSTAQNQIVGSGGSEADSPSVNRSMDTTKGTSAASLSAPDILGSPDSDFYFTRFVSLPLAAQTIAAQTWNYDFAAQSPTSASDFPCPTATADQNVYICVFTWRPSTHTLITRIFDSATDSNFGSSSSDVGTFLDFFGTFSGSAATVQSGDVLCVEIDFITDSTNSSGGNNVFLYDGSTENNSNGASGSNEASHIECPSTTLNFLSTPFIIDYPRMVFVDSRG